MLYGTTINGQRDWYLSARTEKKIVLTTPKKEEARVSNTMIMDLFSRGKIYSTVDHLPRKYTGIVKSCAWAAE